jgi:hypothetical protein
MHQKQPIKKVKNYLKKSLGDMALKLNQCLHGRVAEKPTLTCSRKRAARHKGVCGVCHYEVSSKLSELYH